ncbi:DUF4157 domain-containing protein [Nodosilinea nodulosa]|uniref:eCIS core domain-containing protein n=1 Tax=Nodosilinea nodulosa TaxID=416001 RepID=UPI001CED9A3A|nr:DUF4157 domain-containing protein [Nodosilinea nodulosa]
MVAPFASEPLLARKSTCACGGGCPRCQSGQAIAPSPQTKLRVSNPGDRGEREADRIAAQVVGLPAPSTPHSPADSPTVPPVVYSVLSSPGQPLEPATRTAMEQHFGQDFSRVRVHTGAAAAQSAEAINANAYTVGDNIVFNAGQLAPATQTGQLLIAHELAHVVQPAGQQLVQRDEKPPQPGTAAAAPHLERQDSTQGEPCACLIVIHNNERKARQTAQLMHQHCAYNLLLMEPDNKDRELGLPCIDSARSKHPKDPNECFPPEIAEQCINDEASCEQFLKDSAGSKKAADIMKFMEISLFLSIKKCSKDFSLPVVALHNNDIEDTKRYLDKKDAADVGSLKQDVDKSKKETGEDKIKALKDELDRKFGKEEFKIGKQTFTIRKLLMDTPGKTNIFRWCASDALSKCHIGDPDNPDNVVWVTNSKDFDKLSKKDVNVALQSDASSAIGTDAETDLSTLFPTVQEKLGNKFDQTISNAEKGMVKDLEELVNILLNFIDTSSDQDSFDGLLVLVFDIVKLSLREQQIKAAQKGKAALQNIRYINIETPHNLPKKTSSEVAVQNYDVIAEVLKQLGLHCCGKDAPQAEKAIRQGLEKVS